MALPVRAAAAGDLAQLAQCAPLSVQRRFVDFVAFFCLCCFSDHLDRDSPSQAGDAHAAFLEGVRHGKAEVLDWLMSNSHVQFGGAFFEGAFLEALTQGHLAVVRWLVGKPFLRATDTFYIDGQGSMLPPALCKLWNGLFGEKEKKRKKNK